MVSVDRGRLCVGRKELAGIVCLLPLQGNHLPWVVGRLLWPLIRVFPTGNRSHIHHRIPTSERVKSEVVAKWPFGFKLALASTHPSITTSASAGTRMSCARAFALLSFLLPKIHKYVSFWRLSGNGAIAENINSGGPPMHIATGILLSGQAAVPSAPCL